MADEKTDGAAPVAPVAAIDPGYPKYALTFGLGPNVRRIKGDLGIPVLGSHTLAVAAPSGQVVFTFTHHDETHDDKPNLDVMIEDMPGPGGRKPKPKPKPKPAKRKAVKKAAKKSAKKSAKKAARKAPKKAAATRATKSGRKRR
jgi:hypothetical protein